MDRKRRLDERVNKKKTAPLTQEHIRREAEKYRQSRKPTARPSERARTDARPSSVASRPRVGSRTSPAKPFPQSEPRSNRARPLAEKPPAVKNQPKSGDTASRTRRRSSTRQVRPAVRLAAVLVVVALLVYGVWYLRADHGVGTDAPAASEQALQEIVSDSAILINADNGDVLFAKDPDSRRAPASLTKMMTAYVAIKNNANLDKQVTLTKTAFEGLYQSGASTSGLQPGEVVTVRDLLYCTLLPSGGDAAQALALVTSGNEAAFVELMNKTAKEIGMDSTHFTNTTGLHDDNQYTTARDMARLLKSALGNQVFTTILYTETYTTSANAVHPTGIAVTSSMHQHLDEFASALNQDDRFSIRGGKTGYTEPAGICLASVASNGKKTCIAVTLHATGDSENYYPAVKDAMTLYGKAF